MKNGNISAIFEHQVLTVRFLENARIELDDIKELYAFGDEWANGKPYCMMFDALHHFEVSEDAVEYIAHGHADKNVLAKAYVISTPEADVKAKFHIMFDRPDLQPHLFKNTEAARAWLDSVIAKHNSK